MRYDISGIAHAVRHGAVILYPTDTLWGIGCDACNDAAVRRIFAIKRRCMSKSLIVLMSDEAMLEQYIGCIPQQARLLAHTMHEPLTMIYEHASGLAQGVGAANGSVAVRLAQHDFCRRIIASVGSPLVSTSANISGNVAASYLFEVEREVVRAVDIVVAPVWEGMPSRMPSRIAQSDNNGGMVFVR